MNLVGLSRKIGKRWALYGDFVSQTITLLPYDEAVAMIKANRPTSPSNFDVQSVLGYKSRMDRWNRLKAVQLVQNEKYMVSDGELFWEHHYIGESSEIREQKPLRFEPFVLSVFKLL